MAGSLGERPGEGTSNTPVPLAEIQAAVSAIRYGEVRVVIQDGCVVQIEKIEKVRLGSLRTRGG